MLPNIGQEIIHSFTYEQASTNLGDAEYERFEDIMMKLGYTWEDHKVKTDDGYTLTLFHVTGSEESGPFSPSKPPVLMNHGNYQDAASWITSSSGDGEAIPYHLQLADAGYDVWLSNNRGTWYSQQHEKYNAVTDDEFWMYTWADMGLHDDPANIEMVKQLTGFDKIFYVGYSQGTIQMFYGLSHMQDYYADNLLKVVQLAPCFVSSSAIPFTPELTIETLYQYQKLGVYAYSGPNWERDEKVLCQNFRALCPIYHSMDNSQPAAIQSEKYWVTNSSVDRFQEFAENYEQGEYEAPMVDIGKIDRVPLGLFIGTSDETCSYDHAFEYIPRLGIEPSINVIEGATHQYYNSPVPDSFVQDLIRELNVDPIEQILQ